ncbi:MAG TPA: hypothetical protein VJ603_04600 [Paucimonas sp.]|nr:hypothetical protein [Paucimonas sp.]
MLNKQSISTFVSLSAAVLAAVVMAACGGGGGSPGTTTGNGGTSGTGTTVSEPKLKLALVDGSGAAVTTLSGGQNGTAKATITDALGVAIANAVVKFSASDTTLVEFSPVSASALTDATGVAVMTIKPKDFTSAGALTLKAEAAVGLKTVTDSINMSVGAAPLVVGTLSFTPAPTGTLPAFSALTLNIPVTSNGQPVNTVSGLTLTSLCAGDGTATLVPSAFANGVQSVTYTNNGCLRGTDVITASIGNSTQTISLAVGSANIGTIQFVSSDLTGTSIVLKGSGGLGRRESALLTFRVVDQNNNGLAGVDVAFRPTTTIGGLGVAPAYATTDASGNVTTTVSAGTIPTPVRVIAEATRNGKTISGLSDALTVSTGLPIQKAMSLSVDKYNIEGLQYDGEEAKITVMMADQYGNPVSDNTTVNFVAEGGAVGSSAQGACNTINGGCTVSLKSQAFRPTNGRVTVLAYAQGIENFTDSNGDGQYSCSSFTDVNGNVPTVYRPLVDICVSGGEPFGDMSDPFLDAGVLDATSGASTAGTLDGHYDPANGDLPFPYKNSTYSATGDGKWGINYIRQQAEIIFSGSNAVLTRLVCDASGNCRDWNNTTDGNPYIIQGLAGTGCASQALNFRLTDVNNNPLPVDTTVGAADADKIAPQTFYPAKVLSTSQVGGTMHSVMVKADSNCASGSFAVKITTPKGNGTAYFFNSN